MGNCCAAPVKSQSTSTTVTSSRGSITSNLTGSAGNPKSTGAGNTDGAVEYPDGKILDAPSLRIFSLAELRSATRNFKPESVLGEGGFGKVFKGWVEEQTLNPSKPGVGMVVAVKKLDHESVQGLEQWQSEVNFLGRISHPNLVKLLGYCLEDKELLLVYEFMSRGSLENHIFRRGGSMQPLGWGLRLKILLGAARGLAYLHASEKRVIYRDFKAANILLDSNYDAKLSDFGLAKNGPTGDDSHLSTRVMGTYGYVAPEYVATGRLYVKSDVYGFGVVLLEMISGQRALNLNRPSGQHNFVDWARPLLSDRKKLTGVMDPQLEENYPPKGALQAAQLILQCLAGNPRNRPSMEEVVETLESIEAMSKPREANDRSRRPTGRIKARRDARGPGARPSKASPGNW